MGFLNRIKSMFSTGQASIIGEAKRLYKSGDIAGAVACLKNGLEAREESGKALAVMMALHEVYSEELHLKQVRGYRAALLEYGFDLANYAEIEDIISSVDRALIENVYSGKARTEMERLYKDFHKPFIKLQLDAQQNRQSGIIKKLETMHPEQCADEFVTLVEELRLIGGKLPQNMHSDYQVAQKLSYILPNNLREIDSYFIERSLGRGGFAAVFLASSKEVSFHSAIKIFSPQPSLIRESGLSLAELKERFRREIDIMLKLSMENIPGIVNVRHTKTWRGKPYLTMDYYPKNLSALIGSDDELLQTGRGRHLNHKLAFPLIRQILTSIHLLHKRSEPIIHRDLKPTNILLDKDNKPYIGDFGLAKETSRVDLLTRAFETVTGTNLATQYYGAPEQRGGFKEADQRADVFSLGVIIYRILTGRLIGFHDLEPIQLYVKGLGKDTAVKINDLLNKATRIEVDQRLADVSTFLELFSPKQNHLDINQTPPLRLTPEEQFLKVLEFAYSFAPDGKLPENVREQLQTKARELEIHPEEAKTLEKDLRSRLGLGEFGKDRLVSVTSASVFASVVEKGMGQIIITSEPDLADVFVDGIERDKTPLSLSRIGAGKRTIRLKLQGYFPTSRIERISPDEPTEIHVILRQLFGTIKAEAETFSESYPAHFYLDGNLMGQTPLVVEDVSSGEHAYHFEAEKHRRVDGKVTVNFNEETEISIALEPFMARLSVTSVPEGAAIWLDNQDTGQKTDSVLEVSPGKHAVTLSLDGYKDARQDVEMEPEKFLELDFGIEKKKADDARFIEYGNGIVKDNWTDLEWFPGPDKDTDWNETEAWVESLKFDGGGWRMPTLDELEGLYVEGFGSRNTMPLLKIIGYLVWSSETESRIWSLVRGFLFSDGGSTPRHYRNFSDHGRAFAVRSRNDGANNKKFEGKAELRYSPPSSSKSNMTQGDLIYMAYSNGIIRDKRTGLEWFSGPNKDTDEAQAWVESLKLDGGGWRMPTLDELEGLYVEGFGSRNMMPLLSLNMMSLKTYEGFVWSGETNDSGAFYAFHFDNGEVSLRRFGPNGTFAVRSQNDETDHKKFKGKAESKYRLPQSSSRIEADYYYEMGRLDFSSGDMNSCIENMTSLIAVDKDNLKAFLIRACAKIKEDNSFSLPFRAWTKINEDNPSSAKNDFTKAFAENETIPELASFWAWDMRFGLPKKELERLFPEDPKIHYFLGSYYASEASLESDKDQEFTHADAYERDAFDRFTKAIELDPEFCEAYHGRALARPYDEYEEEIEDYSMAIKLNPSFVEAYRCRAISYEHKNYYIKAINDINKCAKLDPTSPGYQNLRESLHIKLAEMEDEIKDLSERIERKPKNTKYYRTRAGIYKKMEHFTEAIQDYSKAIELSPNLWSLYEERAKIYEETKDYKKAIDDWSKLIEIRKNKPRSSLTRYYSHRAKLCAIVKSDDVAISDNETTPNALSVAAGDNIVKDTKTGMEFVYVPAGKFMMGDIFGDGFGNERPVYEVVLDGFYIGKYPVTQGEWEAVMGDNPSSFKKGDDYPVEAVSWDNVQGFINALIYKKNKDRYRFRLPTEAEWEYAARSGGKKEKYAGSDDVNAVAWYDENSGGTTHPVGKKLPNGLGIFDMSGNVWEWCQDWFGDYPSSSVTDPKGPSSGSLRVLRGGSWNFIARDCRSANRYGGTPGPQYYHLGFRLAFSPVSRAGNKAGR